MLAKLGERTVNLHVISLGRHGEPVLRKLEKAVCVAECWLSLDALRGAHWRTWAGLGKSEGRVCGWGAWC